DITNPADFSVANAASIVKFDTTDSSDADLGHLYAPPVVDDARPEKSNQIVKMNNGRWAVVMGNGYNSANEKPVLLIQYVDGDKALVKLTPCPTTCSTDYSGDGNGLSAPRLMDVNGDGKIDVAYAGDLKGNLWKFDLTSGAGAWAVAFVSQPFFVAKNPSGVRQPIMTAPYAMMHPSGGVMLAVGTGRNVTTTDPASVGTDTVWGIWDDSVIVQTASTVTITNSTTGVINSAAGTTRPTSLVQQTNSATPYTDSDGKLFYDVSRNTVLYSGTTPKRGWYMDWPIGGLRTLHNPSLFSGERILVQSTIPQSGSGMTGETCNPTALPEKTFISVFNIFTGNPSKSQVFVPASASIPVTNLGLAQVDPGDFTRLDGDGVIKLRSTAGSGGGSGAGSSTPFTVLDAQGLGIRSNWREYQ
ncbi:MAG: PilC/PilY family type IV pilus protein, partial [Gammaproteobacteria bacterium]|nr:PilC/PilY family type IV pilus protein [Gammaproteobacteria bacterium]